MCPSKCYSRNDAGVIALLTLIARGKDTNMIARGGIMAAGQASEAVSRLLENERIPSREEVQKLDEAFIRQNLSPGGCADLLAATFFLYDWCEKQEDGSILLRTFPVSSQ